MAGFSDWGRLLRVSMGSSTLRSRCNVPSNLWNLETPHDKLSFFITLPPSAEAVNAAPPLGDHLPIDPPGGRPGAALPTYSRGTSSSSHGDGLLRREGRGGSSAQPRHDPGRSGATASRRRSFADPGKARVRFSNDDSPPAPLSSPPGVCRSTCVREGVRPSVQGHYDGWKIACPRRIYFTLALRVSRPTRSACHPEAAPVP